MIKLILIMIYIIGFSDYFMRNAFYPSTEPTLCFIEVIKSFFWFIITPYRFINDIIFDYKYLRESSPSKEKMQHRKKDDKYFKKLKELSKDKASKW